MSFLLRVLVFAVSAVIGGVMGLVVHELVGHAFPAWVFGAENIRITLHPDFTGSVDFDASRLDRWKEIVIDCGGIAINLLTGFAMLPLAARVRRRWVGRIVVLFGAISVYKALEYLSMSLFYGGPGDPLQRADFCTVWAPRLYWLPSLAALPFAIFPFARALTKIEGVGFARLVSIAGPTLLIGGLFYYRGSVFGDGVMAKRRIEVKARICALDPKTVAPPFALLPVVVALTSIGALAGATARRRDRASAA